jgi:hypothetical protein
MLDTPGLALEVRLDLLGRGSSVGIVSGKPRGESQPFVSSAHLVVGRELRRMSLSGRSGSVVVMGLVTVALLGVSACGKGRHHSIVAAPPEVATSTLATSTLATSTPATSTPSTMLVQTPSVLASRTVATQIASYSPYVEGNLRPGLRLTSTQTADASAWPVPVSACVRLASGAWDCSMDTDFSPCYPTADARSCVFVASPWATTAERILVPVVPPPLASNPPIPADIAAIAATHPWALELTDGRLCRDQLHGAGDWIGTLPLSYSCTPDDAFCSGTADNCLYGYVDRTKPMWTIEEGNQPDCKAGEHCIAGSPDARISGTVTIARAWFK